MNLTRVPEKRIYFEGRKYRLHLAFDNVLRTFDVLREPLFTPVQRLQLAVELLAGRSAGRLPMDKLEALFTRITDEFINEGAKPQRSKEPRALDFNQDAPLIYAAFRQAYGLDLTKQRGRLDWRHFIALFQGLPDDTKIREVIDIRKRDLPEPTPHNGKQIAKLMELKAYYAIQLGEDEAKQGWYSDSARFAEGLIGLAQKRGVSGVGRR
jgi:hypothetical protein